MRTFIFHEKNEHADRLDEEHWHIGSAYIPGYGFHGTIAIFRDRKHSLHRGAESGPDRHLLELCDSFFSRGRNEPAAWRGPQSLGDVFSEAYLRRKSPELPIAPVSCGFQSGSIGPRFDQGRHPGTPDGGHDHSELEAGMKAYLDAILSKKPISDKWPLVIESMLDIYLGEIPKSFEWNGELYTPESFQAAYPLNYQDYLAVSSFTHRPYYEAFILDIPDNFSNGSFLNVPVEEMYHAVVQALKKGYTVAWDGDVSEDGFKARKGLAIMPEAQVQDSCFEKACAELQVTQDMRQDKFNRLVTTDDHLMHITGMAEDQHGRPYFIVKNSWGPIGPYEGFLYMSASYFKLKTISVHFHKDALSDTYAKKWKLSE